MHLGRVALVASLAFSSFSVALRANADSGTKEESGTSDADAAARQSFTEGVKLYKDGDFDAALVRFERAYSTKPSYKVLYNIAQTYFQLREYVEARDALNRYLKEGGDSIDAERRAAATKDLADLEKRIARIVIKVNVAGATVLVDGKPMGTTPLKDPISVAEGERTVSVETTDQGSRQRLLRLAGGEEQTLAFNFEHSRGGTSEPSPNSQAPAAKPGLGAGFWITSVGALTLGAGAGTFGYLALKARSDNEAQRKELGVSLQTLSDSNSRSHNYAIVSDVFSVAAVACAATAVVLYATSPKAPESPRVSLAIGPSHAGFVGSF